MRLINSSRALAQLYSLYDGIAGLSQVCIVKYGWRYDATGLLTPLDVITPIVSQDSYYGFTNLSSVKQAQENMAVKRFSECLLTGEVYPANPQQTQQQIGLAIHFGSEIKRKKLLVTGPRYWQRSGLSYRASPAQAITKCPLRYEYAFGGGHARARYRANPSGIGYLPSQAEIVNTPLPQIEYPDQLIVEPLQVAQPAGFGPIPVAWLDPEKLTQEMGESFGLRVSLAPFDQCFNQAFSGKEVIELQGLGKKGEDISLQLPNLQVYCLLLSFNQEKYQKLNCDTILINNKEQTVLCLWRKVISLNRKYKECRIMVEH